MWPVCLPDPFTLSVRRGGSARDYGETNFIRRRKWSLDRTLGLGKQCLQRTWLDTLSVDDGTVPSPHLSAIETPYCLFRDV